MPSCAHDAGRDAGPSKRSDKRPSAAADVRLAANAVAMGKPTTRRSTIARGAAAALLVLPLTWILERRRHRHAR